MFGFGRIRNAGQTLSYLTWSCLWGCGRKCCSPHHRAPGSRPPAGHLYWWSAGADPSCCWLGCCPGRSSWTAGHPFIKNKKHISTGYVLVPYQLNLGFKLTSVQIGRKVHFLCLYASLLLFDSQTQCLTLKYYQIIPFTSGHAVHMIFQFNSIQKMLYFTNS